MADPVPGLGIAVPVFMPGWLFLALTAGSAAQAWLDENARSTLTTLNQGSRSTWMFKVKPFGQLGSARRSVTVLAVTAMLDSISALMLSR